MWQLSSYWGFHINKKKKNLELTPFELALYLILSPGLPAYANQPACQPSVYSQSGHLSLSTQMSINGLKVSISSTFSFNSCVRRCVVWHKAKQGFCRSRCLPVGKTRHSADVKHPSCCYNQSLSEKDNTCVSSLRYVTCLLVWWLQHIFIL